MCKNDKDTWCCSVKTSFLILTWLLSLTFDSIHSAAFSLGLELVTIF